MAKEVSFEAENIVSALVPGQIYPEEHLVTMLYRVMVPPARYKVGPGGVREYDDKPVDPSEIKLRKRECTRRIRQMVAKGHLVEVSDGHYRRHPLDDSGREKIAFTFRGVFYEVPVEQYEKKLAELRDMTPEAHTKARLEALEAQIEALKKEV